jgi:BirA family biotin operon repressor/biotin-[acetyl-CoA-carboxylase] ligase
VRAAPPAPAILRLAEVESTQSIALRLAAEGAADRTVVVAAHQTAGRGRRGRRWEDEPGTALLASIVVRSPLPLAERPRVGFVAALAVADALRATAGLDARLRWPNDVLVAGRKIAGILLEARGDDLVVGIGVNVNQRTFAGELAGRATSILIETGRAGDRDGVLAALLGVFDAWRSRLERGDFAAVREAWIARADTLGRTVRIDGRSGVAIDLDADGALLVRDGETVHRVTAGALEIGSAADPPAPAPPAGAGGGAGRSGGRSPRR